MSKYDLRRYHEMVQRFNVDLVGIEVPSEPTILSADRTDFRMKHLQEELDETAEALVMGDFTEAVDGLIDLTYVALGTLVEMGICVGGVFEEVHDANMRKVRGVNPKRPDDTIAKPEGWQPPDLAPYLRLTKADLDRVRDEKVMHEAVGEPKRMTGPDRNPRKKIMVMGYARHGKDTAAEIMSEQYGLSFTSSSMFCAEHVMMPYFERYAGYDHSPYKTVAECFEDRGNHRQEWYKQIWDYNRPDASALGRAIFDQYDIYAGIRSRAEFAALRNAGVFDLAIWIDASQRGVPPESSDSCTVEPWMADYVVDNSGTEEDLAFNLKQLLDRVL